MGIIIATFLDNVGIVLFLNVSSSSFVFVSGGLALDVVSVLDVVGIVLTCVGCYGY